MKYLLPLLLLIACTKTNPVVHHYKAEMYREHRSTIDSTGEYCEVDTVSMDTTIGIYYTHQSDWNYSPGALVVRELKLPWQYFAIVRKRID